MSGDMENIDKGMNTSQWVYDRLAGLAPAETWQPDVDAGFAYLHRYDHLAKRRLHLQRGAVLLLLVACVVVLAMPTTRGIARHCRSPWRLADLGDPRSRRGLHAAAAAARC